MLLLASYSYFNSASIIRGYRLQFCAEIETPPLFRVPVKGLLIVFSTVSTLKVFHSSSISTNIQHIGAHIQVSSREIQHAIQCMLHIVFLTRKKLERRTRRRMRPNHFSMDGQRGWNLIQKVGLWMKIRVSYVVFLSHCVCDFFYDNTSDL